MSSAFWAALLKPFFAFFLLACICLPVRYAVIKWFPEGRIKRFLLRKVSD